MDYLQTGQVHGVWQVKERIQQKDKPAVGE
jgi:hypothetical protein